MLGLIKDRISDLLVTRVLRLGKNATIKIRNADGTESTVDLAELAALDNISAADLAKIDGITNGTIAAGKAVVVDSNKDASAFRNVGLVNLDAGSSGTAGTVDVFPTTASKGKLAISVTDQTGNTTVSLVAGAMAAARTITLRDPGAAASILTTTDATAAATTATAAEITNAADVSARVQGLTVTGAVTAGVQSVELNHASVLVAATIANAANHQGLFIVKNTSASGTEAHTLTLTAGTFNGTNNVATLNAPNEALVVYFDSAGNGTIVENIGSVALS
jgi:hypothetical protein